MLQILDKEALEQKFNDIYKNKLIIEQMDNIESLNLLSKEKMKVRCKVCNHYWETAIKNVIYFRAGCYQCCKGRGYSMDEIKILNFIIDNYVPKEQQISFRHAEQGGQLVIRPKKGNIAPASFYSCDGYIRYTFEYDPETKKAYEPEGKEGKGAVFGVLGDHHHSDPLYYGPDGGPPGPNMTHKQNYEYTMNRLKHIGDLGHKVFHIWITDFRRPTRELEKGGVPHLFDYMNLEKRHGDSYKADYSLLTKGTQRTFGGKKKCPKSNDLDL